MSGKSRGTDEKTPKATVTPLYGKLGDMYGRKATFLAAILIFLAGSLLSGLSQTMGELIGFRALQGIGAGGMLPIGMVIIGDMFTLEERARAQALFAGVWGVSSIAGPLVGAILTGVFATKAIKGGEDAVGWVDGNFGQVIVQIEGVLITIVYCAVVTFIVLKVVDMIIGLRVDEATERDGLDLALHGETIQ